MNKQKTKTIFKKTILTIWILIGTILAIWTGGWYLYAATSGELGEALVSVIFFAAGLKILFLYFVITILVSTLYYLIKFIRRKKK